MSTILSDPLNSATSSVCWPFFLPLINSTYAQVVFNLPVLISLRPFANHVLNYCTFRALGGIGLTIDLQ